MSNRTLSILVIISLAFNLAFLGSFVYHRFIAGPHLPPDFPPHPPREFLENIHQNRELIHDCRERFRDAKTDFMKSLHDPDITDEELRIKLDCSIDLLKDLEENIGKTMIEARKNLTPEQREKMFEHMKNRPRPRRQDRPFTD